jgi:5-formyltetrahydrofolate cyclo-ligase
VNKSEFRKGCIERLKSRNRVQDLYMDKVVTEKIYRYIKENRCKVVMLYLPLEIEINISALIKQLRIENITLLVPFMVGKSFRLVKYRLPIKVKRFGVKEPNISNYHYKRIDLALVPVIGIDRTFRRVGFGKGFYDRFFEKSGGDIDKILFVGRRSCICSKVITDDYDVEGNLYITPNRFLDKKQLKRLHIRNLGSQ